jgi:DNA invertase Pin-like site-specific DNA recombinase
MTKAVIYARVSSDEQQKEGFSIPAQIDLLKSYAKKNNIEIVKTYEESQTAKQAGRIKFNEMINFLHTSKDIKTILVEKTDRLYRNFKDYVEIGEDEFEIHLVKENEIIGKNATSHQKFVHGIKVLMAKNFIDKIGRAHL